MMNTQEAILTKLVMMETNLAEIKKQIQELERIIKEATTSVEHIS